MTEDRDKYIDELNCFVQQCDKKLTAIVSSLGWSMSSVKEKADEMVVCPFFASHRVPVRTLELHLENCQWKAEGYTKNDKPFSEPQFKLNNRQSIVFDEDLQSKVLLEAKAADPSLKIGVGERLIPRTSDRLFSDFTSDERKALYDYVVSNTAKPEIGRDITNLNDSNNELGSSETSFLEQAAQERDLKRRRARYRGVHTNKKSHTEILREVISQQMEMYVEYSGQKNGERSSKDATLCESSKNERDHERSRQNSRVSREFDYEKRRDESKSKHRRRSRSRSRHRSRSRSKSRGYHKKSRHRSKERKEKKKKRSRSREKHSKHSKKEKRRRSRS